MKPLRHKAASLGVSALRAAAFMTFLAAIPALRAGEPAASAKTTRNETAPKSPRETVLALSTAYDARAAEAFLALFDEVLFPDFAGFSEEVREILRDARQINTKIVIDKTVSEGRRASVQAQWRQSYVYKKGVLEKDNGRCEFLLRKDDAKSWLLTAMKGKCPF